MIPSLSVWHILQSHRPGGSALYADLSDLRENPATTIPTTVTATTARPDIIAIHDNQITPHYPNKHCRRTCRRFAGGNNWKNYFIRKCSKRMQQRMLSMLNCKQQSVKTFAWRDGQDLCVVWQQKLNLLRWGVSGVCFQPSQWGERDWEPVDRQVSYNLATIKSKLQLKKTTVLNLQPEASPTKKRTILFPCDNVTWSTVVWSVVCKMQTIPFCLSFRASTEIWAVRNYIRLMWTTLFTDDNFPSQRLSLRSSLFINH